MTATQNLHTFSAHVLPERPHLDHLRTEAKHRHAALKAVSQSARLSDAQFLVARDYGYANWMALKAEVDRRRQLCGTLDARPLMLMRPRPAVSTRRRDRIAAMASCHTVEQALFPATVMAMIAVPFGGFWATLLRALLG